MNQHAQSDARLRCSCDRVFHDLDQEHHDWLLSFEERGLPGVVEILEYLDSDADCDTPTGCLRWSDFEEFVAMHSWQQPADVYLLASFVEGAIRRRAMAPV